MTESIMEDAHHWYLEIEPTLEKVFYVKNFNLSQLREVNYVRHNELKRKGRIIHTAQTALKKVHVVYMCKLCCLPQSLPFCPVWIGKGQLNGDN